MTQEEPEPTYLVCPIKSCFHDELVSAVDPDASLGDMFNHLLRHVGYDQDRAYALLAKVREVDSRGIGLS
jgi:hypothetical protein